MVIGHFGEFATLLKFFIPKRGEKRNCLIAVADVKRTMPRKRRKAIITETTPDIPFQKVRVEWVDCVSDSGWANEKEFNKMSLAKPINEGWLYSKDKISIKLFASYDKDDDGITFGDRTMIPRQWVKKIQKL
jgi:hypothetical protein